MLPILLYSLLYGLLFTSTEVLYYKYNFRVERTRKLVHLFTGLIALSFPYFLADFWQAAVLCGSFLILLGCCEKQKWLKSITGVERKSYGSWLFALVVLCCFYIQILFGDRIYYIVPLLVLTLADLAAALIGKKYPIRPLKGLNTAKSLGGSVAFFAVALAIGFAYVFFSGTTRFSPLIIFCMASGTTLVEIFSKKGWDNLTIPISVIIILKMML